jgi:hypothetical protein
MMGAYSFMPLHSSPSFVAIAILHVANRMHQHYVASQSLYQLNGIHANSSYDGIRRILCILVMYNGM